MSATAASAPRTADDGGFATPPHAGDEAALRHPPVPRGRRALLRGWGRTLVGVLLAGQGLFTGYVLASYGRTAVTGDVARWARFSATGWVPGDTRGNTAMALHVLVAVLVLTAGALQLLPIVRRRAPIVHRWSGRVYVTGCMIGALTGLALVWGRGTVGDLPQHVAITINAVLLLGCAALAWRTARARRFDAHRTWALRTWLVANGVFYFRILLALWLVVHQGPVGFDPKTFSGPFLTALAFTVYVAGPLLLLEGYRAAERSGRAAVHVGASVVLALVAVVCAAGTAAAAVVFWAPRVT